VPTTTPTKGTAPSTVVPPRKAPRPRKFTLTHNTIPTQTNTATTLTTQGFQPPYTQKVCHANSPHTSSSTHRNIMPTQDEKLTQGIAYTQSFLIHTPYPPQKESCLVVFITNITPLCRQGMSFTYSHHIIALHNCNNPCAFCEDMRTKVSMSMWHMRGYFL